MNLHYQNRKLFKAKKRKYDAVGGLFFTYLVGSKGYVINFGSNGISGSVLQYLTRHMSSDLRESESQMWKCFAQKLYHIPRLFTSFPLA